MVPVSFVKPLGRYADVLNLLSFFPLMSYLKFGYMLRKRREQAARRTDREGNGREGAEEKEEEKVDEEESDSGIPSAVALLLLLFAELCTSFQLFDPQDKLVRRAVGEVGRMKRKTKPGLAPVLETIMKLLQNDDFYELIRFLATSSCIAGIFFTISLRLYVTDIPDDGGLGNPFKQTWRTASRAFRILWRPRTWLAVLLGVAFILGNWSLLAKFIRRPIAVELVRALARLARAISAALVATGSAHDGELPFWCAMQSVAAVARATHLFGYERASWSNLLQVSKRSVCGGLAMEVLCFVQMLPCALRRQRMFLTIALFAAPCVAILCGGTTAQALEPILTAPEMLHRLSMTIAIIGTLSLFLGGFAGMMSAVSILQVFSLIHGLDKMKY